MSNKKDTYFLNVNYTKFVINGIYIYKKYGINN